MWLAHQNRLPSRGKLAAWGLNVNPSSCLCNSLEETRDHLFLYCDFAMNLWNQVFSRLENNRRTFISFEELLSWTRQSTLSAPSLLEKLVVQAAVYNIWRQRNSALHSNGRASTQQIFKMIDRDVRNTISARRHIDKNHNLCFPCFLFFFAKGTLS